MDALVAVAPTAAREWLGEIGLAVQVELIPDGIPDAPPVRPESRAALRRELRVPAGSLCVGSVGRLDPVKDQATLLRALASLTASGLDAVGVLVGDGPERPALQRLAAELGLRDRLRFLGARRDVPRLLAAFDLFVQASLSEALPNALLEGLGAGLPVVATAVGGTLDVVRPEVGLLVPPADPGAMALAVLRLARDAGLRHRLGAAGRALVAHRYSLDAMLAAYADLYARLLPPPAAAWAGAMRKAG
jgi:glycosyltransferase involved in cell wall biosynthesis